MGFRRQFSILRRSLPIPARWCPRPRFVDRVRAALRRESPSTLLSVLLLLPALALISPRAASQGTQAPQSAAREPAPAGSQPASSPVTAPPSSGSQPVVARIPIVVELFTSEGCSDCPPADKFLAELGRTQPVAEALIIPLEEHVDYWDHDGWRDPFSDPMFTWRQQWYAQHFGLPGPATPEMVVDGRAQFLGRAVGKMREAIEESARAPQAQVALTLAPGAEKGVLQATIRIQDYPSNLTKKDDKAEVRVAVTEDDLASQVGAGENAGKHLEHEAVVRKLISAGEVKEGEPFSKEVKIPLAREWNPEHLHVVVFLEAHSSHQILGAATSPAISR